MRFNEIGTTERTHRFVRRISAWCPVGSLVCFIGLTISSSAAADTTLTVDLGTITNPVSHVASGSLYGLIENKPADLNRLVAPLRPKMFTNPAENQQQPVGDAIAVAQRIAPLGATVTIRLADWFRGWPYNFTNMNDWLSKIQQTVSRKEASGVDNYYGYEIWNEPGGTWTSAIPFNDFWQQTYAELRRLDPEMPIIGPSLAWYDSNRLRSFLTFARDNNCLPDIVVWHELSGGNLTANLQNYRAMEQQLGIGPLRISINEYSGNARIDDEGKPGVSAPLIAKFERFDVDTACISFWDVPHPGRLGSLLATDTEPNGGWWFYKWYGDMSGDMVKTVPPAPDIVTALDGFANLDTTSGFASVLLGGANDGTIRVVVEGLTASRLFSSTVHATIERTPWVNRTTIVNATQTLQTLDLPIANDRVEFSIPNASQVDGYRIYLTGDGAPNPTACDPQAQSAYLEQPASVPGTVEAENFDPTGYHDATAGNEGGAYRPNTDVDIKEVVGGYAIGWMTVGEWLEYTVDVSSTGSYTLSLRAGAVDSGRTLDISACGEAHGTVEIPQIGSWGEIGTATLTPINLTEGLNVIRVSVGDFDYVDFDSMTFTLDDSSTPGEPADAGVLVEPMDAGGTDAHTSGGGSGAISDPGASGSGSGSAGFAGASIGGVSGGIANGGIGGESVGGAAMTPTSGTIGTGSASNGSGCGCHVLGRTKRPGWFAILSLLFLFTVAIQRRRYIMGTK